MHLHVIVSFKPMPPEKEGGKPRFAADHGMGGPCGVGYTRPQALADLHRRLRVAYGKDTDIHFLVAPREAFDDD